MNRLNIMKGESMAGIDNITGQILDEARDHAAKIQRDAQEEAALLKDQADKNLQALQVSAEEKSRREVDNYMSRVRSSEDIMKKKSMLFAKQEMVDEVLSKAYDRLEGQESAPYFEMIKSILKKSVRSGSGEMIFSARDLQRLPSGFEEEAIRIAKEKGGMITIRKTPGKIESGFILSYGGIEENCSLRAIFDADRDHLQDISCKALFS